MNGKDRSHIQRRKSMALQLTGDSLGAHEGHRLRIADGTIFLVLDGQLRHIPDPPTYASLFGNVAAEQTVIIGHAPAGPALTSGAVLAKPDNGPEIYMVSNGQKRHILAPQVMVKYGFDHGSVKVVPHVLIASISTGNNIA
jgi:hypothetical protein